MTSVEISWVFGRTTLGSLARLVAPVKQYGAERVPQIGGVVLAFNHFHWIDVPILGGCCPRYPIAFVAKVEAHRIPAVGQFIRSLGTIAVRRGESDREAVRRMREVAQNGGALGVFVEGTRQRSGVPGEAQPGAAMVAIQEQVPVVPCAIHGSQHWRLGNFAPVSIAWGEPMRFDDLPRNAKGYREATAQIQAEIRRLWEWLVSLHELDGRPAVATPPG
jgi:1-acyl-sn-glycerol-3-phosphate acyltransferase